ncbi:hypothetical protein V6R21_18290 [Limibacter armeniacum]|uniref:hypothetical protein n=1 Tax=Limibacter armeniacum TaxID=466084 RepID=UPI002FE56B41
MKLNLKLILIMVMSLVISSTMAQGKKGRAGKGQSQAQNIEKRMERVSIMMEQQLALNQQQSQEIKTLNEEFAIELIKVRDSNLSKEEKKSQVKALVDKRQEDLQQVLGDEKWEQWKEKRKELAERRAEKMKKEKKSKKGKKASGEGDGLTEDEINEMLEDY